MEKSWFSPNKCVHLNAREEEIRSKANYVKYVVHVNKCEIFISSRNTQRQQKEKKNLCTTSFEKEEEKLYSAFWVGKKTSITSRKGK